MKAKRTVVKVCSYCGVVFGCKYRKSIVKERLCCVCSINGTCPDYYVKKEQTKHDKIFSICIHYIKPNNGK